MDDMNDSLEITSDDFFPIKVSGEYSRSRFDMMKLFYRHKPKDMSYYEVDMIIKSETEVSFNIFGMEDFCYGGKGSLKNSFDATVEPREVLQWIDLKIRRMAVKEFEREEHLARLKRIDEIEKTYQRQIKAQLKDAPKGPKVDA